MAPSREPAGIEVSRETKRSRPDLTGTTRCGIPGAPANRPRRPLLARVVLRMKTTAAEHHGTRHSAGEALDWGSTPAVLVCSLRRSLPKEVSASGSTPPGWHQDTGTRGRVRSDLSAGRTRTPGQRPHICRPGIPGRLDSHPNGGTVRALGAGARPAYSMGPCRRLRLTIVARQVHPPNDVGPRAKCRRGRSPSKQPRSNADGTEIHGPRQPEPPASHTGAQRLA